jgi:transcriptional regulator with XRE-family HTH domain
MASALRTILGTTVRALRTKAKYSQEGFADAIGVHRTYMGTLERGDANPTLETLEMIAKGLGVTVSALLRAAETGELPEVNPPSTRIPPGRSSRLGRVAESSDPSTN